MSKIEIGKQYVTRGGRKVRRILCVDEFLQLYCVEHEAREAIKKGI